MNSSLNIHEWAYPHSPIDGFQSNLIFIIFVSCHHRHEDIKPGSQVLCAWLVEFISEWSSVQKVTTLLCLLYIRVQMSTKMIMIHFVAAVLLYNVAAAVFPGKVVKFSKRPVAAPLSTIVTHQSASCGCSRLWKMKHLLREAQNIADLWDC